MYYRKFAQQASKLRPYIHICLICYFTYSVFYHIICIESCTGSFYGSLAQTSVLLQEENSTEKIPPQAYPVSRTWCLFLKCE